MRNNMMQVRVGDVWWWVDIISFEGAIRSLEAENVEMRIWRPLTTVIGWQEFRRITE